MNPSAMPASTLDDIDARQNEVLLQLKDLNARVERVLSESTPKRTDKIADE